MDEQEILRKVLDRLDALEKEVDQLRAQLARPEKPSDIISAWAEQRRASSGVPERYNQLAAKPAEPPKQTEPPSAMNTDKPFGEGSLPRLLRNFYEIEPPSQEQAGVVAPASQSSPEPPMPPKPPRLDWKALLRRLNMLPPDGEGSLEIQVGTWWTVRIGIIMAVIGAVFFGIWASQNTPAWVKWGELLGISLGVCALGLMIERLGKELAGFGGIVFAGGLALIDFTAFAAYAVPAVKIFTEPAPSFALQMLATALITGCALWRRSETIANMAILLGYVACLFSFAEGLLPFALTAALLLGSGAVFFYLRRGWTNPFTLAVPLTYLITALIAARWIATKEYPAFWICAGYPLLTMVLYGCTDLAALLRGIEITPLRRRVIQLTNSSGAVLIGFIVTRVIFNDQLDVYYFTFGSVLLAGSVVYCFMKHPDVIMQGYFVKGTALITMGLITVLDARALWVSLAIQSLVLLLSAKRSRLVVVELASTLTWIVSFVYFTMHYEQHLMVGNTLVPLWSADGLMAIAYFLFTCVLFGLHGRWFFPGRAPGLSPRVPLGDAPFPFLSVIHFFALTIVAFTVSDTMTAPAYMPPVLTLLSIILALSSWGVGHWAGYWAGAFVLSAAYIKILDGADARAIYDFDFPHLGYDATYWMASLPTIATTFGAAVMIASRCKKQKTPIFLNIMGSDVTLHFIWLYTLTIMFYRSFDYEYFLLAATLTGIVIGSLSLYQPLRRLANLAPLPLAVAVAGAIIGHSHLPYANVLWPYGLIFAGAVLIPLGFGCVPALKASIYWLRKNDLYLGIQSLASGGIMLLALRGLYTGWNLMMALTVAGVLIALLRRWPGLRTALAWGIVYVLLASWKFFGDFGQTSARESHLFLTLAILTAIGTAGLAALTPRLNPAINQRRLLAIQWGLGALALVMLLFVFVSRTGAATHYTSVFWGLSAISLFVAGLADRIKPFRVLGLVALGLCIGRVFLFDIQSTVYRIAAFVAIGCVLLAVGFLYNKYRDIIEAIDRPAVSEKAHEVGPTVHGDAEES